MYEGIVDFADILPTLANIAKIDPANYYTDGKSFYTVLTGSDHPLQSEVFIHYSPRWGKFKTNRWVMDGRYKLYQDGRFYNTSVDLPEKDSLINLTSKEQEIRKRFESILWLKENEFPFEWNSKKVPSR